MSWVSEFFGTGFYAEVYRLRITQERTNQEVAAVLQLLGAKPPAHILDWCCGWGRHAVEFAKRGFRVTGLDITPGHIEAARQLVEKSGVKLELICADFRQTPASIQADLAVNLFTSGLGYGSARDDLRALRALHAALKPGARFLMDTMSRPFIHRHFEARKWEETADGRWRIWESREYDFRTNRIRSRIIRQKIGSSEQEERELDHHIFDVAELEAILRRTGFEPVQLVGDFDAQTFGFNSKRIIIVSERR